MSLINLKKKVVQAKIVYYGPGRGGKTTNLEFLYKNFKERFENDMVCINTRGDRTIFFDFLPFDVGKIKGYDVKIQLYTVPGQVKYDAIRRLVLKGVDGVVFVADSLQVRKSKNFESLKNLQTNLTMHKKNIYEIPLVLQYNKQDLVGEGLSVLDFATMDKSLNSKLKVPSYPASALKGDNVVVTLKKIISLTMGSLQNELK